MKFHGFFYQVSLLVTSYYQFFLQFFFVFWLFARGLFLFVKNRFIKRTSVDFFHRMFASIEVRLAPEAGQEAPSYQMACDGTVDRFFFGGEGARVKFFFFKHGVLVFFQPGLRVSDLIRSLMFFSFPLIYGKYGWTWNFSWRLYNIIVQRKHGTIFRRGVSTSGTSK